MISLLLVFLFLFSPLLFVLYYLWEALGVASTSAAAIATFFTALAALSTAIAVFRGNRETRKVAEATRKATEATREAAEATRDATEATRKASEGQLFMQMSTTYSSEKMLRGMRKLIRFEEEHKENYAKVFGEKLRNNYPEVREEDEARRRFAHQYLAVRILWEHEFISKNLFDDLWKENQKEFYEEYIEPLKPEVKRDMDERRKKREERKKRKDATNKKTDEKRDEC